jgi:hypothetical protein
MNRLASVVVAVLLTIDATPVVDGYVFGGFRPTGST